MHILLRVLSTGLVDDVASPIAPLRPVGRVAERLSLLNLLVDVVTQVGHHSSIVVLLLIEGSHAEALVGQSLVFATRGSALLSGRSHHHVLSRLNGHKRVTFLDNKHLLATAAEAGDCFAKELVEH